MEMTVLSLPSKPSLLLWYVGPCVYLIRRRDGTLAAHYHSSFVPGGACP